MTTETQTVLVTGATGQQGGAVAAHLLRDGWTVRALTRDPAGAAARRLVDSGAEVVAGDLDDPASLATAVAGAQAVFSVHSGSYEGSPDGYDEAHEIRSARNLAQAAAAADVGHLVHTSAIGVDDAASRAVIDMLDTKWRAEEEIRATGIPATFLRPASFMENYLGTVRGLNGGALATPLPPDYREALIAVSDIAAFAVAVLTDPEHHRGKGYALAGDKLPQTEIAATLTAAVGREVPYVRIPIEQIRAVSETTANTLEEMSKFDLVIDFAQLREVHPGLTTFEDWTAAHREELVKLLP